MSPPLQKLYDIFGAGVVFLPLPKCSKQPLIKKWQNITFADTQKPDYQKALEHCVERGGNIGVLLGPASEGLVSVDWDHDELVDPFIALCPKLVLTTRTKGKRGCNFFLRIKPGTPYPNSQSSYALRDKDGCWVGRRSIHQGVNTSMRQAVPGLSRTINVFYVYQGILRTRSLSHFYSANVQIDPKATADRRDVKERAVLNTNLAHIDKQRVQKLFTKPGSALPPNLSFLPL
jgi:hypothetical protein